MTVSEDVPDGALFTSQSSGDSTLGSTTRTTGSFGVDDLDITFTNTYPAYEKELTVTKSADDTSLYVGQTANYTLTVTNNSEVALNGVILIDSMLTFADAGTIKVDGVDATVINNSSEGYWYVPLGSMDKDETVTITYSRTFENTGDYPNTAYAIGYYIETPVTSNTADESVTVTRRSTPVTNYYDVTVNYYETGTTTTLRASNTISNLVSGMSYDIEDEGFVYATIGDYAFDSASAAYAGQISGSDVIINLYYTTPEIIPPTEPPLASPSPEPEEDIDEEEVPTAPLPTTGGIAVGLIGLAGAGLTSIGLFLGKKKK